MKIPFYTIYGPTLKRNKYSLNNFCRHPLLATSSIYTGILGFLGVILSVMDILMIIKCGPTLPAYIQRNRPYSGKILTLETERDLKLLALFISLINYALLIVGSIAGNSVFFLPHLILYSLMLMLELIGFILKIFNNGIDLCRTTLFTTLFTIYNWLIVFCAFWKFLSRCDY